MYRLIICVFFGVAFGRAIENDDTQIDTELRIFNVPRDEVTFRLWNREHPDNFRPISYGHLTDEESIKADKPFKILVHGWQDAADRGWYTAASKEYLKKDDMNVIGLDWKKPAQDLYPLAVKYTADIGIYLGELCKDLHETLGVPYDNMHVIGHSLGAHISGFAGQYVWEKFKTRIGRITGLDPAGPMFNLASEGHRLSPDDASFVDIIHTDGGKLGLNEVLGHVDFYPNGGAAPQPGCLLFENFGIVDTVSCSHNLVKNLHVESINSYHFKARECESFKEFQKGACNDNEIALMGENIKNTTRGVFYLTTHGREPYAMD